MSGSRRRIRHRSTPVDHRILIPILFGICLIAVISAGLVGASVDHSIESTESPNPSLNATTLTTEHATAEFTWEPDEPIVGQEVTFDASGSIGEVDEYRWQFGDGTGDETVDPEISHTYDEPGEYVVILEIQTDEGTDRESVEIVVSEPDEPTAAFSWDPDEPTEDETVTFDAETSDSPNDEIVEYQWNFGDGTELITQDPTAVHNFETGEWTVDLTVVDDVGETASTESSIHVERPEPTVVCELSAAELAVGDELTLDATASEEGIYAEFDVDGDGTIDTASETLAVTVTYDEAGTYHPQAIVYDELERPIETGCGELRVIEPEEPLAVISLSPEQPQVNETVTFDASNSRAGYGDIVEYRWDFTGDGTVDDITSEPMVSHTYTDAIESNATVTIVDELGGTAQAHEPVAIQPLESSGFPIGLVGILLALALVAIVIWWLRTRGLELPWETGSRSSDGRDAQDRDDDDKRGDETERGPAGTPFETGIVEIGPADGAVTVETGFEPSVLTFVVTNGAAGSNAQHGPIDDGHGVRTTCFSVGVVTVDNGSVEQFTQTVADDAKSLERGTVSIHEDTAFELLRHDDERIGRLRGRVTGTDETGFSVEVETLDGAPPDRLTVLYRAFDSRAGFDVDAGRFETPNEPGTQELSLDVDASVIDVFASTGIGLDDRLLTTDRTVGLSMGIATNERTSSKTPTARTTVDSNTGTGSNDFESIVCSGFTSPQRANYTGARCDTDHVLALCYQDGDEIAGHTMAAVTELGERLELSYDRVYSGRHKIDPLGSHPVSYVAFDAGEFIPAIGVEELPEPGETLEIECGFEPGLIEVTTCRVPAAGNERATGAEAIPFDWSEGTAIVRDGEIAQYCVDGVAVDESRRQIAVRTGDDGNEEATGVTGKERNHELKFRDDNEITATDGGSAVNTDRDRPTGDDSRSPAVNSTGDRSIETDTTRSERIATTAALANDGTIVGRDELRVTDVTGTGFELRTGGYRVTKVNRSNERVPLISYRAWPKSATGTRIAESNTETVDTTGGSK